ncbi:sodium:proton antiporter [Amylibacter marinus]|uniref:Sodium:proton antiporter n=1 Tax=Amylibacter marinus TaxID=1475483 RepID=A0ABQ5VY40_9RHOB|nr:Na+/H+ antiporter subunit E [Amylibacter marinus]GLQ36270.1 sodium:proton antiporter [Amylibacter marinus]
MFRSVLTVMFLFVLWLLLSGVYKPIIVGLGFFSCVFAVWIVRRMDNAADAERLTINLRPLQMIKYTCWLLVEIAKANWAVTKIVLSPEMPINQKLFRVPFSQKTDLGQTIFANSITLTPGTISVELENDYFLVHALSYGPEDKAEIAKMDTQVSRTESTPA